MVRIKNKKLLIISIVVLTVGILGYLFIIRDKNIDEPAGSISQQAIEQDEKDPSKIRLIATGDMIAHDSVNANAKSGNNYDYFKLVEGMKPYFDKADLRFCNQATPAGGTQFGISGYPVFNAPFEFTRDMVKLGCNVVNTGTNHTNDRGQALIDAMAGEWDKQNILAHAGANRSVAEKNTVKYFESKGVEFAFLSYSTYTNSPVNNGYGVTMYERGLAQSQISEANKKADIIIVSMRWGTEYSPGINGLQTSVSQDLADFGADVVFGHGPHVLEPVKRLKGSGGNETLVWYSLGNFLSTQIETEALTSVIAIMDIDVESKKIATVSALPIYMHYEWTADQKAREDLLTRHDLAMYPLDQAAEPLSRSQLGTTVAAQTKRITDVLNQFTKVNIIKSSEY